MTWRMPGASYPSQVIATAPLPAAARRAASCQPGAARRPDPCSCRVRRRRRCGSTRRRRWPPLRARLQWRRRAAAHCRVRPAPCQRTQDGQVGGGFAHPLDHAGRRAVVLPCCLLDLLRQPPPVDGVADPVRYAVEPAGDERPAVRHGEPGGRRQAGPPDRHPGWSCGKLRDRRHVRHQALRPRQLRPGRRSTPGRGPTKLRSSTSVSSPAARRSASSKAASAS